MVYSEPDLIVPTLKLLRDHRDGLNTSDMIKALTQIMKPTGHDLDILSGRTDTVFSQKVRNLIGSHRNLERKGLATFENGISKITDNGLKYLEENEVVLDSLKTQGFKPEEIESEVERDYSGIVVEEGALERTTTTQRSRSQLLRGIAVREFKRKNDNRLFCVACGFDFSQTYGELGKDFIVIHHEKPVHTMDIEGSRRTLEEALKKVIPVCANCHSMIHREKGKMLSVEELKEIIK